MNSNVVMNKTIIDAYYGEMDTHTVYIDSIWCLYRALKEFRKNNVIVVSNNRYVRGIVSRLRIRTAKASKAQLAAEQYLAMKDALLLLAKKNVPVYYYNRIGKEKTGFVNTF